MTMVELRSESMRVRLDGAHPRVIDYLHMPSGRTFSGPEGGTISVNDRSRPWSEWEISLENQGPSTALYRLRHVREGWMLEWLFTADTLGLFTRLAVATDPSARLRTIDFPQAPLLCCNDWSATYWRERWRRGHWDALRGVPWPEPEAGIYVDLEIDRRQIKAAIPDLAPLGTMHACVFDGTVCAFLQSNYPFLPLLTQVAPSERYPERSETFVLGLNRYQYRVRNLTMPPLEVRVVFLVDINGDGVADECDYHLWLNRQFPAPNPFYQDRLLYKVFNGHKSEPLLNTTYKQTLEIIRAVHHVTDGLPQVAYLIGWQYDGIDTGYPAHDKLNPVAGTREELQELCREAKERYNTIVSYHINLDDAYRSSPEWDEAIIGRDVDGELMRWTVYVREQPYHINHTKHVESGAFQRSMERMLALIPVEQTIHFDAFRHSNHSWEPDGFIGSMEELCCGVRPIVDFFAKRGIDVTIEGANNWAVDVPGWFSAVWHMDFFPRTQIFHGKLLGGGRNLSLIALGLGGSIDDDLTYHRLQNDWGRFLDFIFLGSMLYRFYLELEMLELRHSEGRWHVRLSEGVTVEIDPKRDYLRVAQGDLIIADGYDRFVPVDGGIFIYSREGGTKRWRLPDDWCGKKLDVYGLSKNGRQPAPPHVLSAEHIEIHLPPRMPVKLVRC